MKVIPPGVDASMVQPRDPARRVGVSPDKVRAASAPEPVTQVAVSPSARAAAALSAAGRYSRTGEAAVVEKIVGTGDPNAEFKEQVVGLLVDMLGRTRQQQQQAAAREEAAREQQADKAENARRAEEAVGAPAVSTAPPAADRSAALPDGVELSLSIGFEPSTADAADESDDPVAPPAPGPESGPVASDVPSD